ncbi:glycosyltransferase family 2 protein [Pleionea sp. CnH1-48]|uniref:glycosyltransferase family 2 protein n=1 Tax=Pleionea sp. CnH1-48 TaxID=2954494 RepID=UPI002097CD0C|nr:glycosyltransferase family 2 protein [Pleionea sp. CnH1-48]MCO7223973.1 glycosyltransferase family 2 protein [Pleionea sp. CnH1-48]
MDNITIAIPAKNEAISLDKLLPQLTNELPNVSILVVNDGSTDNTPEICEKHGVGVATHPYSKGNGAAIKTAARTVTTEYILFMDADSQHRVSDVKKLIDHIDDNTDMIVGARDNKSQASLGRLLANKFYNWLSSKIVEHKIEDLTSGLRLVKTEKFCSFLHLLPNGFSYPTTITMAFFRAGYSIRYVPIKTEDRIGKSHINLLKDGFRFIIIIFKIGTLYSPLKLFTPISMMMFIAGLTNYIYTLTTSGRFTNMTVLLIVSAVIVFLIGLVSEQINSLQYDERRK